MQALSEGDEAMSSTALRLITQLPFPNGVIPPAMRSLFVAVTGADEAEKMANAFTNGAAIDSLVILLRLLRSLGLSFSQVNDKRLFELALHDFGRKLADDYIVKGELFETLYPREASNLDRVDMTLGELIYHPMVSKVLWSLRTFQLFCRKTWAKRDKNAPVERYYTGTGAASLPTPICVPGQQEINLGHFFSKKLGPRHMAGGSIVYLAYQAPNIIPVIKQGGQSFDSIRAFIIKGPADFQQVDKYTVQPVTRTWRYHLRAVLNLAESDIHLYHHDTSPVVEQLVINDHHKQESKNRGQHDGKHHKSAGDRIPRKDSRKKTCHTYKARRSQHAPDWTFEDSPLGEFLLIYEIHTDDKGSRRIEDMYGEYLPATRGDGM